jgi:pyruvate kinase
MRTRKVRRSSSGRGPARLALLSTLGPSSLRRSVIADLAAAGVTQFRVNMAHTELEDLEPVLRLIQRATRVPICLDLEGGQIRTGAMQDGVTLRDGARVRLTSRPVVGTAAVIPIHPGSVVAKFAPGSQVSIGFDSVVVRIDDVRDGTAHATVVTGGEVGPRKAVTSYPKPEVTRFTDRDRQAVRIGRRMGVHTFGLAFCESPEAVDILRRQLGKDDIVIAKIESRAAVRNLTRISETADRLLIDRGDLSHEVKLETIPLLQKAIIRRANSLGTPVYVATNLLESMVVRREPTRAEVNDVINTLIDGADGLVLAAETAVGKYPVEAATMIGSLLREYERSVDGVPMDDLLGVHPLAVRRPRSTRRTA